ncbi:ribonuclease P subunit p25 family protein [Acidianus hospitalis]|jgi:DNA-binding protein Alba|uniref:DNA-binding protein n=2 Tax=Acidianus hospitalis TaxID=563177 RepID=A0A2T9X1K6_9CREN|nr:DNA-binding protein [Acidianus hospitalis]PVU73942.1 DNA-binding protein [Acidianus hospitalis]
MMNKPFEVVVSRSKSVEDHVLEIIEILNHNSNEVDLKGYGFEINKAVDIYNALKDRLKEGITLEEVSIGSETKDRKRISYLLLRIKRSY